jgi:hypothetical protein
MNEELAKQIIAEALNIAIKKGCFDLVEVNNVVGAINFINASNFTPKETFDIKVNN